MVMRLVVVALVALAAGAEATGAHGRGRAPCTAAVIADTMLKAKLGADDPCKTHRCDTEACP